MGSVHPLHGNLATWFIAVKESLRPNSSKYCRVCEKKQIKHDHTIHSFELEKSPISFRHSCPLLAWESPSKEERYFQGRINHFSGWVRKQRPWAGGRPRVKWASGGPVRLQRLRAGLVGFSHLLGEGSRAQEVYLVSHRFQLCVSPVGNHSGRSGC